MCMDTSDGLLAEPELSLAGSCRDQGSRPIGKKHYTAVPGLVRFLKILAGFDSIPLDPSAVPGLGLSFFLLLSRNTVSVGEHV